MHFYTAYLIEEKIFAVPPHKTMGKCKSISFEICMSFKKEIHLTFIVLVSESIMQNVPMFESQFNSFFVANYLFINNAIC